MTADEIAIEVIVSPQIVRGYVRKLGLGGSLKEHI